MSGPDIRNVYRGFSKSDKLKLIIIDFLSASIKDKILNNWKELGKQNGTKLSAAHLKLEGPQSTIYVSEYITPKMKRLHFLVRDYSSTHGYKYCWVTPGAIYLRRKVPRLYEYKVNKIDY